MTRTTDVAVYARLVARIHGLPARGGDICAQYTAAKRRPGCDLCGYSADTHLLRDVLALHERAEAT